MENKIINEKLRNFCRAESAIRKLQVAFQGNGNLYLVGGAIRSLLTDHTPTDIDLTTTLEINEASCLLESSGIRVIPTGLKHDTVSVFFPEEDKLVELTALRLGSGNIEADLGFRDFTINAMAYSLLDDCFIDPYNGLSDLKKRRLKAVGDAEDRFREDPLRVLRLVRFCCELAFDIDPLTLTVAKRMVPILTKVAVERVRDELSKILVSQDPVNGFTILFEMGVLDLILPEVAKFYGFEQNEYHKADLFFHTLELLNHTEPDLILRLAALLHDVGKPASLTTDETGFRHFYRHEIIGAEIAEQILERLKFPCQIIEAVTLLVKTHMRPIDAGPGGLRRLLRDTGEHYQRWRAIKEADTLACKVDSYQSMLALKDFDSRIEKTREEQIRCNLNKLAVTGYDLMEIGIKPGPEMGRIIKYLQEYILDNPEENRKDVLIELVIKGR